ncbi:MAG: OmpA family protein [Bacteroidota bacterium]
MRALLYLFLIVFTFNTLLAQSKKSKKLYEKSEEALRERNFGGAVDILKKIIKTDPTWGEPYLRLATTYSVLQEKDSTLAYFERYTQITPFSKVNPNLWITIANMNFQKGNYEKAHEALDNANSESKQSPQARHLAANIEFSLEAIQDPKVILLERLPDEINRLRMQYFPVLTVDNNVLIFTAQGDNSDEELLISYKVNGNWSRPESISPNINSPSNEGACTISADGRTLIFTSCNGRQGMGSCDLYISQREGNAWSNPKNMGPVVNSVGWESQPALSADGKTLYFASSRPGGLGARDIWVTKYNGIGWSEPQNLGSNINTSEDDITPFIHVNGQSLFFSSKGREGLGGYDIYLSNKEENGWSKPINLGYPINSFNDEVGIFITADGQTAYFSKEIIENSRVVKGELMMFQIKNDTLVKNTSSYVTGRVLNEDTQQPLQADFSMEDLNQSGTIYEVSSDSVTGRYFLVLTQGHEYGVFVSKDNYLFEDLTFKSSSSSFLKPDTVDIYLRPIKEGVSMILENVYFEFNEYALDSKSTAELDQIYRYLLKNSKLNVRIEGYTDNIGTESYNLDLSTKRAKSVYNYLLNKGIDRKRLTFEGYGSIKPIDSNESEEGRERNRRIEFRIIKASISSE